MLPDSDLAVMDLNRLAHGQSVELQAVAQSVTEAVCIGISKHLTCFHQLAHKYLGHTPHNCNHWGRHIVTAYGLENLHKPNVR